MPHPHPKFQNFSSLEEKLEICSNGVPDVTANRELKIRREKQSSLPSRTAILWNSRAFLPRKRLSAMIQSRITFHLNWTLRFIKILTSSLLNRLEIHVVYQANSFTSVLSTQIKIDYILLDESNQCYGSIRKPRPKLSPWCVKCPTSYTRIKSP